MFTSVVTRFSMISNKRGIDFIDYAIELEVMVCILTLSTEYIDSYWFCICIRLLDVEYLRYLTGGVLRIRSSSISRTVNRAVFIRVNKKHNRVINLRGFIHVPKPTLPFV